MIVFPVFQVIPVVFPVKILKSATPSGMAISVDMRIPHMIDPLTL